MYSKLHFIVLNTHWSLLGMKILHLLFLWFGEFFIFIFSEEDFERVTFISYSVMTYLSIPSIDKFVLT